MKLSNWFSHLKPDLNRLISSFRNLAAHTVSCSQSSMNRRLTETRASSGHSWNQSIAVQLVTAGNLRPRTRRVEPTGEKHNTTWGWGWKIQYDGQDELRTGRIVGDGGGGVGVRGIMLAGRDDRWSTWHPFLKKIGRCWTSLHTLFVLSRKALQGWLFIANFRLKAGLYVRSKHKHTHKRKHKPMWTGTTQAQAQE